jgi:hypothetical protein
MPRWPTVAVGAFVAVEARIVGVTPDLYYADGRVARPYEGIPVDRPKSPNGERSQVLEYKDAAGKWMHVAGWWRCPAWVCISTKREADR